MPKLKLCILAGARYGIPILGVDLSVLYYEWKERDEAMSEPWSTPLQDVMECLLDLAWLESTGTKLLFTCERHPLVLWL